MSEEDQEILVKWLRENNDVLESFILAYFDEGNREMFRFSLEKYKSDFLTDLARWIKRTTRKPLGERLTVRQRDAVANKIFPIVVKRLFS